MRVRKRWRRKSAQQQAPNETLPRLSKRRCRRVSQTGGDDPIAMQLPARQSPPTARPIAVSTRGLCRSGVNMPRMACRRPFPSCIHQRMHRHGRNDDRRGSTGTMRTSRCIPDI
jgi:hypothetical protein